MRYEAAQAGRDARLFLSAGLLAKLGNPATVDIQYQNGDVIIRAPGNFRVAYNGPMPRVTIGAGFASRLRLPDRNQAFLGEFTQKEIRIR